MISRSVLFALLVLLPVSASAETVELVTYYPSSAATGQVETDRLHAGRGTVGAPYSMANPADAVLTDGTLLVADRLGIGPMFGTTPPAGSLHVVGPDNRTDMVLFLPGTGAGADLRVGIGTPNPQQTLSIVGNTAGALLAGLQNTNPNTGTNTSEEWRIGEGLGGNDRYLAVGYTNSGFTPADYRLPNAGQLITTSGATNGLLIGTNANAPVRFVTNGVGVANSERMRITGDGNIGIGVPAPTQRLDVAGTIQALGLIAPGVIRQAQQAFNSTRQFTTSQGWVLVANTAVTITVAANSRVLLLANGDPQVSTGSASWGHVTIFRDGANLSPMSSGFAVFVNGGEWNEMTPIMWVDSPPAGTHTYQLAFLSAQGHQIDIGQSNPTVLIALEIRQ